MSPNRTFESNHEIVRYVLLSWFYLPGKTQPHMWKLEEHGRAFSYFVRALRPTDRHTYPVKDDHNSVKKLNMP